MTTALEGGEGSASRPGRSLPPGKTRYPLYRRLGGPQGRSGQVRKISVPPGFDPRTIQPVVSRYTDWAVRPTFMKQGIWKEVAVCSLKVVFQICADVEEYHVNPSHSGQWNISNTTRYAMYVKRKIAELSPNHCCSGNATMHYVCCWDTCHCQLYKNIECFATIILWHIYIAGNNTTFEILILKYWMLYWKERMFQ